MVSEFPENQGRLVETFTMKPTKRQVLRALQAFDLGFGVISWREVLARPLQVISALPVNYV